MSKEQKTKTKNEVNAETTKETESKTEKVVAKKETESKTEKVVARKDISKFAWTLSEIKTPKRKSLTTKTKSFQKILKKYSISCLQSKNFVIQYI